MTTLEEIMGHLGAARMQLLPTDDKIIAEHIIAAHELAKVLWRGVKATETEEDDGRCPNCGEDELDGGRCYYCGWAAYDTEPINDCVCGASEVGLEAAE